MPIVEIDDKTAELLLALTEVTRIVDHNGRLVGFFYPEAMGGRGPTLASDITARGSQEKDDSPIEVVWKERGID